MSGNAFLFYCISGRLNLAGLPYSREAIPKLCEELLAKQLRPALLVTTNLDHVAKLIDSECFRQTYSEAKWRTLDGTPLVWMSRLLGAKHPRVTGTDVLAALPNHLRSGQVIAIVGGSENSAHRAAENLQRDARGGQIVAIPTPHLTGIDDPRSTAIIDALTWVNPSVVVLCMGSPKQELWFSHWRQMLPSSSYIAVGAAVDFASNSARRAPSWMQAAGLEWLHRLAQDPARLSRRYLVESLPALGVVFRSLLLSVTSNTRGGPKRSLS